MSKEMVKVDFFIGEIIYLLTYQAKKYNLKGDITVHCLDGYTHYCCNGRWVLRYKKTDEENIIDILTNV